MQACHGLGPVNSFSHLDGIQVNFQDSLLAPQQFNQESEISLQPFAEPRGAGPEKQVFCRLLGNGAGTPWPAACYVFLSCLLDLFMVESPVFKETLVF